MIQSSSGLQLAIILGPEPQRSIWCPSGIDLFVSLEIESMEEATQEIRVPSHTESEAVCLQTFDAALSPPVLLEEASRLGQELRTRNLDESLISGHKEHEGCEWETRIELPGSEASDRDLEHDLCLPIELQLIESPPAIENKRTMRPEVPCGCNGKIKDGLGASVIDLARPTYLSQNEDYQVEENWKEEPDRQSSRDDFEDSYNPVAVRENFELGFMSPRVECGVRSAQNENCEGEKGNERVEAHFTNAENLGERPEDEPRMGDHDYPFGAEVPVKVFEDCTFSSKAEPARLRCPVHEHYGHEWNEDLENLCIDQSRRDAEPYSCNENRSWSPQLEEYSCTLTDTDSYDQDTTSGDVSTCFVDEPKFDRTSSASLPCTQDETMGETLTDLGCNRNPNSSILFPQFPDIESYNAEEISAAWQLLELSCSDCIGQFSEEQQDALQELGVNNLGLTGTLVERIVSTLPDSKTSHDPVRDGKFKETSWRGDDMDPPGVNCHNDARTFGMKRIKPNKGSDCGHAVLGIEGTDFEVLDRRPKKRQFRSLREFVPA